MQQHVNQYKAELHWKLENIRVPTEPVPEIPNLAISEGVQCTRCSHIACGETRVVTVQQHLRDKHQLYAKEGSASAKRADIDAFYAALWRPVWCQRFFPTAVKGSSQAHQYFVVYREPTESPLAVSEASFVQRSVEPSVEPSVESPAASSSAACSPTVRSSRRKSRTPRRNTPSPPGRSAPLTPPGTSAHLVRRADAAVALERFGAQLAASRAKAAEAREQLRKTVPAVPNRQTSPFQEHTQFLRCLSNMSWDEARRYTSPPTPLPKKLDYMQRVVKSTVLAYQRTVAVTSRWARIRVMQENTKEVPAMPLIHYQGYDLKHAVTLVKVFTFFYHVLAKDWTRPATLRTTNRQEHTFKALLAHLDGLESFPLVDLKHTRRELTCAERLCHDFWLSLLEQTTLEHEFGTAISTVFAFIAIDPHEPEFRAAHNFHTDLSATKKLARFAACQVLWDRFAQPIPAPAPAGDEPDGAVQLIEAEEVLNEQDHWALWAAEENSIQAANDGFRQWVYRYLTDENNTPMGWIITTIHYISAARYGDTIDAFVRWEGDRLTVRGVETTFDQFKRMVFDVKNKAEDLLDRLLFAGTVHERPAIAWGEIRDNPSHRAVGYSPFNPTEPPFEEHGRDYIPRAMGRAVIAGLHRDETFTDLNDYDRVRRYCERVQKFLDYLFLLIHFCSGEPARLTELLSVQIENSVENEGRNIFLYDGHVAMVPRYHKGYNRDKSLKLIYRFLPRSVGALVVHYVSLVRPFYEDLAVSLPANSQHSHIARARSSLLWTDSAGAQYANSLHMADLMRRVTETLIGAIMGPLCVRHTMTAYRRRAMEQTRGRVREMPAEELEAIQEADEDEVHDLQAGHTAATAKAVYAVETARVFRQVEPREHLRVSREWHARLGLTAAEEDAEWAAAWDGHDGPVHQLLVERIAARADVQARVVLRENFGKDARFRSPQQEQVVNAVLHGEPAVSYVARTGSGKSFAFLLPALSPDYKQAIVVTPLVSLRTDLMQRCERLAITASSFGDEAFDETASLLFAMPEHLPMLKFSSLVSRLRAAGTLERIVVDEFHYLALPDHEYRPALLALGEVARFKTPITLLSATVPVEAEGGVYEELRLSNVARFRESTVRPNLQYEVERMPQARATVADIAAHVQARQQAFSKAIVYLSSIALVEGVAAELDAMRYHGSMKPDEREAVHRRFAACTRGIMVATTAYSTGVDVPNVDLVQRYGYPDHPIVWLQEGGRGGRGDAARCVVRVVLGGGLPSYVKKLQPEPRAVLANILQENGPICIRKTVDAYMDGDRRRTCCREEELKCCACQRVGRPAAAAATPLRSPPPSLATPRPGPSSSSRASVEGTPASSAATATVERSALSSGRTPFTPAPPARWPSANHFVAPTPDTGRSLDSMLRSSPTLRLDAGSRSRGYATGSPSRRSSPAAKRVLSPVPASSPVASASQQGQRAVKIARVDRRMAFQQTGWQVGEQAGARLKEGLRETVDYWTEHCVGCFVAQESFDHPKADCSRYTGSLSGGLRHGLLGGTPGKGFLLCYSCVLPPSMCAKYYDDNGRLNPKNRRKDVECTFPHVMLDTWACLWLSDKAREVWLARIADEGGKGLGGSEKEQEAAARAHFQSGVPGCRGEKVSRICADVHWFTETYFRGPDDRWEELW